jgi:uncharacterized DUF497 family protein
MEFEWDPVKATIDLAKHGISFVAATRVFDDPLAVVIRDRSYRTCSRIGPNDAGGSRNAVICGGQGLAEISFRSLRLSASRSIRPISR